MVSLRFLRRFVVVLPILAGLECGGEDLVLPSGPGNGPGGSGGAVPSASSSSVLADPDSITAGREISTIIVAVRDSDGTPVEGATVSLEATGSDNTLTQPS